MSDAKAASADLGGSKALPKGIRSSLCAPISLNRRAIQFRYKQGAPSLQHTIRDPAQYQRATAPGVVACVLYHNPLLRGPDFSPGPEVVSSFRPRLMPTGWVSLSVYGAQWHWQQSTA
eukprot:795938-Rhodomonas_salina.3